MPRNLPRKRREEPKSALLCVDSLFADFCGRLEGAQRDEARRLSFTLGLAPEPLIPWSRVFSNEVTLAAPWMFAEAMPGVPDEAVRHALFGHALAVIEAMGTDRIEDGQVQSTPGLLRVLAVVRDARARLRRSASERPAAQLRAYPVLRDQVHARRDRG